MEQAYHYIDSRFCQAPHHLAAQHSQTPRQACIWATPVYGRSPNPCHFRLPQVTQPKPEALLCYMFAEMIARAAPNVVLPASMQPAFFARATDARLRMVTAGHAVASYEIRCIVAILTRTLQQRLGIGVESWAMEARCSQHVA